MISEYKLYNELVESFNLLSKDEVIKEGYNGADEFWDIPGGLFFDDDYGERVFVNAPEGEGGIHLTGIIYGLYSNSNLEDCKRS